MLGRTRCEPIGELAAPERSMPPIITVTWRPLMGTVPVTGEGGRPPPVKRFDRLPAPHSAFVEPTAPEPFSRLTAYPAALPRSFLHAVALLLVSGKLVLKKTRPPKMM